jgi:hypothetical protein
VTGSTLFAKEPRAQTACPIAAGRRLRHYLRQSRSRLGKPVRQTRHKSVEVARRYMRSAYLWRNNVTEKGMLRSRS